MIILSNGHTEQFFSCYQEVVDFIGNSEFNAVISGDHSQYTLSYLPITQNNAPLAQMDRATAF